MNDTGVVRATVLCEVSLDDRHPSTATRHVIDGAPTPTPSTLQIVRYDSEPGFYLLYLDAAGDEMTDTWHQTLDDAIHQAECEFALAPSDWQT